MILDILKKIRPALLSISLCLFFASCNSEGIRNTENMKLLHEGMTKDEAMKVMGEPLVNEVYNKPDVWYYYVESQWSDGARTSDECAELVFENDRLVGWGKDFYKRYQQGKWGEKDSLKNRLFKEKDKKKETRKDSE